MESKVEENVKSWFEKHNIRWLSTSTIFLTLHGSRAYGTSLPESDLDLKGICIPPKKYFFGYSQGFEQAEGKEPYDTVIYELRKFIKLAADCNPNIIEVLNTSEEDWVIETPLFRKLWTNRDLFLSKKARHTFSGYAASQLKRIKSHRSWLLNPPTHLPTREEFGLPTQSKLSWPDLGATTSLIEKGVSIDENVMLLYQLEQKYHNAKREWDQYQNWVKTRNRKRAELEAKFGFDCKHAGHLVRLMRMCEEILREGKVYVKRPDARELKEIRQGAWSYDQLIEWAENQERLVEVLYQNTTAVPHAPPRDKLDNLCVELIAEFLNT